MSKSRFINNCIELHLDPLTELKEISKLNNKLKDCFGLVCNVNKLTENQFVIIITKKSVKNFQDIVSPFIIPNLKYKIGLNTSNKFNRSTEREYY